MENSGIFILITIFYLFISGLIIFLVIKNKRKLGKRFIIDKESLKLYSKWHGANNSYNGREYNAKYQRGSNNSPPSFSISIKINSPGIFKITLETAFDKFAKRINIAREIQTGDNKFDERFYIDTPTSGFTSVFLDNAEVRNKINNVFDLGFTELSLKKGKLTLVSNLNRATSKIDDNSIKEALDNLFAINDNLLTVTNYQGSNTEIITKLKVTFYSITATLGVIGFTMFITGIIKYKPFDAGKMFITSLIYSIIALIIYFYYAVKFLRGLSSSHKDLMLILVISIFTFFISGYGAMLFFNGFLDNSVVSPHNVAVIKKYYRRGKNGKTYYIKTDSWRSNRQFEVIRTSRRFYRNLQPNSYITINTKQGKFGYEWLKDYNIAN